MIRRLIAVAVLLMGLTMVTVVPAMAGLIRIVDDIDSVLLSGNVHPLARAEFDMGPADQTLPMERIVLALKIPRAKQAALVRFNRELLDPSSANYQRWLTPAEFGERFGPSGDDIAAVTGWLTSHGFTVEEVAAGRTWISFSGNASQVNRAFRTLIHDFYVDGRVHHANATEPSIPRGLLDLVAGPLSLHNFPKKPLYNGLKPFAPGTLQPSYTNGASHSLSPADFATIYNLNNLYHSGIDGSGQSIAIVGRTNPSNASANWAVFRSLMGLPANPPQVIVNGPDPGDQGAAENVEADLDVEWAGAVARNATIKFVTSQSTVATDGVDLSAQYIVNNNLAPVMSVSFSQCEANMGTAGNTFYNNLWAQAAAQGITVFVASGDSGAAGCSAASSLVAFGTGVNGLSSTPHNVAVGGTQFNEGNGSYWNSSNGAGYSSAVGYIPEKAWNESGSVSGGSGLWATGGGASATYAKPAWQVSPGVPADGQRDVPDVSLTASAYDGYLVQTQGQLSTIGGTSAGSPSFAGLMALIVQKTGQRQGNANARFYQLANAQYSGSGPAIFHDTTMGGNGVPGVPGYSCTTGYDLATGLGSVDGNALVANWNAPAAPSFSLAAASAAITAVQGGTVTDRLTTTVAGGFNSSLRLSISGLPTGAAASFNPAAIAAPGAGSTVLTLSAGSTTPAGNYPLTVTGSGGGVSRSVTLNFYVTAAGNSSSGSSTSLISNLCGLLSGTLKLCK